MMIVRDLILALVEEDMDAEVIIYDHGDGHYLDVVYRVEKARTDIYPSHKGKVVIVAEN